MLVSLEELLAGEVGENMLLGVVVEEDVVVVVVVVVVGGPHPKNPPFAGFIYDIVGLWLDTNFACSSCAFTRSYFFFSISYCCILLSIEQHNDRMYNNAQQYTIKINNNAQYTAMYNNTVHNNGVTTNRQYLGLLCVLFLDTSKLLL